MSIYLVNGTVLSNLADTVRNVYSYDHKMTLDEMTEIIKNRDYEYNTSGYNGGVIYIANRYGDYTNMSNSFNGNTSVKGMPFVGNDVINMASAYRDCRYLTGNADIGRHVVNFPYAYAGCKNITGIKNVIHSTAREDAVNDCSYAFYGSGLVSSYYIGSVTSVSVTYHGVNCAGIFMDCTNFGDQMSRIQTPFPLAAENIAFAYKGCTNLGIPDLYNAYYISNAHATFQDCSFLRIDTRSSHPIFEYKVNAQDMSCFMQNATFRDTNLDNRRYPFKNAKIEAVNMSNAFDNCDIMGYAYAGCYKTEDFSYAYRNSGIEYGAIRYNMRNVQGAYKDCKNLVDVYYPFASAMRNASELFMNCTNLRANGFIIGNFVNNHKYIIDNCPNMNNSAIVIRNNFWGRGWQYDYALLNLSGYYKTYGGYDRANYFFHNTHDNFFAIVLSDDARDEFLANQNTLSGITNMFKKLFYDSTYTISSLGFDDIPTTLAMNSKYINHLNLETNLYDAKRVYMVRYVTVMRLYNSSDASTIYQNCSIGICTY